MNEQRLFSLALSLLLFLSFAFLPFPRGLARAQSEGQGGGESLAAQPEGRTDSDRPGGEGVRLTLLECIELALKNNLDIRVVGYAPAIASEDVQRSLSDFDPVFSSQFSISSAGVPLLEQDTTNTIGGITSTGKGFSKSQTEGWTFENALGVRSLSGATLSLSARTGVTRAENSSFSESFAQTSSSDIQQAALSLSLRQPLLKGGGTLFNRSNIVIAQNNLRMSTLDFEDRVMNLLLNVNTAYWSLVFTREDLKAKEESLQAAQGLLRNNEIKLAAGALDPIEVTRARARVAEREQDIVISRALIKDAEDDLRRIIGPNAMPLLSTEEIIPSDTATLSAAKLDPLESVNHALSMRPDVRRQIIVLESLDIIVARTKNLLLPQVDVFATCAVNGFGNTLNDDLEMIETLDETDTSAGILLSVPLGNRLARSQHAQARYERLQALANYAIIERNTTLAVKKAIRDVSTSLQSIATNRVRLQARQEQLDAEKQKYDVGQSISLDVLDAQEALQEAESALIRSNVSFNLAMARYYRDTAKIFQQYNIAVVAPAQVLQDSETLFP